MGTSDPDPASRGSYTRGYLPHVDHAGLIHGITFRLADAFPGDAARMPDFAELDGELDRGHGSCLLRRVDVAVIVRGAFRHFDGERYDLGPWVVMPNHVHVVVRPRAGHGLAAIVQAWKSFTAKRINGVGGKTGTVWQREYFDRFMRNERQLAATTLYIGENPVRAGLVGRAEEWEFGSAGEAVRGGRGGADG